MSKRDGPISVLPEPEPAGEIIETFPEQASLELACNVPGHYEDGAVGRFATDRESGT